MPPSGPFGRNREIRVFLSSTFEDLQAERDHLIRIVFPELRRRCEAAGFAFVEIDLRWGLTHEQTRNGETLAACLDEIDKSHPFFVGLIGGRYGSTVPVDGVARHRSAERSAFVRDWAVEDASYTEIECRYALDTPETREHSLFYLIGDTKSDRIDRRLMRLCDWIRRSGCTVREDIGDLEALGELVLTDLWSLIAAKLPKRAGAIDELAERSASFERRCSSELLVLASTAQTPVTDHPPMPWILAGPVGSGKSATLMQWVEELRARGTFVVSGYARAIGDQAAEELVRSICSEVRTQLELPATRAPLNLMDCLTAGSEKLEVAIVIDGLDQIDSHNLEWLPDHLPPGAGLFASSADPNHVRELTARGWRVQLLSGSFTSNERAQFVEAYFQRYGKRLEPADLERICESPATADPLFLATFANELRLFGHFERLGKRIGELLASQDLAGLFTQVLVRVESALPVTDIVALLAPICYSRFGLNEGDLRELVGCTRLTLSRLLLLLDGHVTSIDGYVRLSNNDFRIAIERRYDLDRTAEHQRLAVFFDRRKRDVRPLEQALWHFRQCQDNEAMSRILTRPESLSELAEHASPEIANSWRFICATHNPLVLYRPDDFALSPAARRRIALAIFEVVAFRTQVWRNDLLGDAGPIDVAPLLAASLENLETEDELSWNVLLAYALVSGIETMEHVLPRAMRAARAIAIDSRLLAQIVGRVAMHRRSVGEVDTIRDVLEGLELDPSRMRELVGALTQIGHSHTSEGFAAYRWWLGTVATFGEERRLEENLLLACHFAAASWDVKHLAYSDDLVAPLELTSRCEEIARRADDCYGRTHPKAAAFHLLLAKLYAHEVVGRKTSAVGEYEAAIRELLPIEGAASYELKSVLEEYVALVSELGSSQQALEYLRDIRRATISWFGRLITEVEPLSVMIGELQAASGDRNGAIAFLAGELAAEWRDSTDARPDRGVLTLGDRVALAQKHLRLKLGELYEADGALEDAFRTYDAIPIARAKYEPLLRVCTRAGDRAGLVRVALGRAEPSLFQYLRAAAYEAGILDDTSIWRCVRTILTYDADALGALSIAVGAWVEISEQVMLTLDGFDDLASCLFRVHAGAPKVVVARSMLFTTIGKRLWPGGRVYSRS